MSADVRDQLIPQLDADIEDLGECYLKHVQQPVRAFRVGAPGERPLIESAASGNDLKATVAVIPFLARDVSAEHEVLGQALADDVITALSRSSEINVVSRLSTTAFRGREATLDAMARHLKADYFVSGSLAISGDRLQPQRRTRRGAVAASRLVENAQGGVKGVIQGQDELARPTRRRDLRRNDGARTAVRRGQGLAHARKPYAAAWQASP